VRVGLDLRPDKCFTSLGRSRGCHALGFGWDLAILARSAAAVVPSRTTYVQPTLCDPGATACAGIHDARFCEYVAVSVEGADCGAIGLAQSKPFCVVTTPCIDTNYAVKDRDCKVLRYQAVRDGMRAECAPGAPTFVTR
jgi:hypothetical protein